MLNLVHLARTDLNLLVVFSVVLEERHVARAAIRLNLTPSAISHALMRLRRLFNDPLFLRMPRGVSPTARALEIAAPVADILGRIDHVVASAAPFDAATSNRRFVIGVPDAVMVPLIEPLLTHIADAAPKVDIGIVHVMPDNRSGQDTNPWLSSLERLDTRDIDIAILPIRTAPARFHVRGLYSEDFIVAMRAGHAFRQSPTLAAFCASPHLLVSQSGLRHGFVDDLLAEHGKTRRVALTVPTFMMALTCLPDSDLLATLPRHLVARHAPKFGLAIAELPVKREADRISAIATRAAMQDAGIAWLLDTLTECTPDGDFEPGSNSAHTKA